MSESNLQTTKRGWLLVLWDSALFNCLEEAPFSNSCLIEANLIQGYRGEFLKIDRGLDDLELGEGAAVESSISG